MTHRLPMRPSTSPLLRPPTLSPSMGQVGRLVALLSSLREGTLNRREFKRMPLPFRFELASLETKQSADQLAVAENIGGASRYSVMGKDLSPEGIGLIHTRPLPYRLVRLTLSDTPEPVWLDVDLSWCRFVKSGHYESGGRLLIDGQAAA